MADIATLAQTTGTQLTVAYLATELLQYLKDKRWAPFINAHTVTINRITGAVVAVLSSLGIHYTFNAESHTLVITGLCASCIAQILWAAAKQWAFQQAVYKGIVSKPVQQQA